MKLVGVVALVLGGAFVVGCNGGSGVQAKAPANRDISELLQEELSHTIVGTTSIASAELPRQKNLTPPVDDEPSSPAVQTWGAGPTDHDTAASDLAANPYTTADAPRDIYDPR